MHQVQRRESLTKGWWETIGMSRRVLNFRRWHSEVHVIHSNHLLDSYLQCADHRNMVLAPSGQRMISDWRPTLQLNIRLLQNLCDTRSGHSDDTWPPTRVLHQQHAVLSRRLHTNLQLLCHNRLGKLCDDSGAANEWFKVVVGNPCLVAITVQSCINRCLAA
jgi:hypothetical protein